MGGLKQSRYALHRKKEIKKEKRNSKITKSFSLGFCHVCVCHSQVVVPPLPGKALFRQLPFRGDEGIFDDSFIEERRAGLEQFLNK